MSDFENKNRWTIVLGALIVQIILGTVYAFSVFVKPLETAFEWNRATTQWAFSFALAFFAITMIPAGRLQDRIGPRKVASIGGILLGLSFLLGSAIITGSHPWTLYLTYGVIGGAGIGFAYVCPIAACMKWFPDKKGLITGLAVAGFGAGALFFAGPASVLLQEAAPAKEAIEFATIFRAAIGFGQNPGFGIGWKAFFLFWGIICTISVLLGAMLLRNPPAGWTPHKKDTENKDKKPKAAFLIKQWLQKKHIINVEKKPVIQPKIDFSWHDMVNTPLACMLWITFIFSATSGLMAIGQWKPMISSLLQGKTFAPAWMGGFGRFIEPVGILAIFNALGRIFWGKVSDRIGRPRSMMLMFIAQGIAFMFLVSVKTHLAIFIASAWVGLNFGGNFALFPSATADYFGTKNIGMNYGCIFTAYGVAGILGPAVGGVLFDITQQYMLPFIFAGILCFIAAIGSIAVWGLSKAQKYELTHESTADSAL